MVLTGINRFALLLSLVIFLTGCASLPSEPDSHAVLIIPLTVSAAPGNDIWWDYQIFSEHVDSNNVQPFFVRPQVGKEYETVMLRESGLLRLNGWNSRNKNTNSVNAHNLSHQVVVHAGYINVYQYRMVVRSENNKQSWRFEILSADERRQIAEDYQSKVRNAENWPIFETW